MKIIITKPVKKFYGGPSEETAFALAHDLNTFSDQIAHSLTAKGFECVLAGKIKNDPTESRFSLNTHLGGHHLALDVSIFA